MKTIEDIIMKDVQCWLFAVNKKNAKEPILKNFLRKSGRSVNKGGGLLRMGQLFFADSLCPE